MVYTKIFQRCEGYQGRAQGEGQRGPDGPDPPDFQKILGIFGGSPTEPPYLYRPYILPLEPPSPYIGKLRRPWL